MAHMREDRDVPEGRAFHKPFVKHGSLSNESGKSIEKVEKGLLFEKHPITNAYHLCCLERIPFYKKDETGGRAPSFSFHE